MPTITLDQSTDRTFVEFTRVYKNAGSCEVKTQPVTVALQDISSVRPSNRLGKANHRSTITLTNGVQYELAEKYSEVSEELAIAG